MYIPTTVLTSGGGGGPTLIYDSTLGVAAASFDVTSIPATYDHLFGYLVARGDKSAVYTYLQMIFNNDSSANYKGEFLAGSSVTAHSEEFTGSSFIALGYVAAASSPAGACGTCDFRVLNYTGTVFNKHIDFQDGFRSQTSTMEADVGFGEWMSTAAVTQLTFFPDSGNFIAGSRLTIYGL